MRGLVLAVGATVALAACAGHRDAEPPIDRPPAPAAEARRLSLEEAGFLAAGALVELYGATADPLPTRTESAMDRLGDQAVWRLDLTIDVTVEDRRVERRWRMWVGTAAGGEPAVLRAHELG